MGKLKGMKPLRRPKRGLENNIKIDLREIGLGRYWTRLTWLRIGTSGGLL
jgi:hypothetical protein